MEQYGKIKHRNPHTMYIIRGIPGSGKSEMAKTIATGVHDDHVGIICEADEFMVDKNGKYKFDHKKLFYAHNSCFRKAVGIACSGVYNIIVSNTNINALEYMKYIRLALIFDMNIQIITLDSTFSSIHTSDDKVIKSMLERWSTCTDPREAFKIAVKNQHLGETNDERWDDLCLLCLVNNMELNDTTRFRSRILADGTIETLLTYRKLFDATYDKYLKANTTTESDQS